MFFIKKYVTIVKGIEMANGLNVRIEVFSSNNMS